MLWDGAKKCRDVTQGVENDEKQKIIVKIVTYDFFYFHLHDIVKYKIYLLLM